MHLLKAISNKFSYFIQYSFQDTLHTLIKNKSPVLQLPEDRGLNIFSHIKSLLFNA
uniref:Uncharacterized protein n=1 Tax=uncultured Desulfobacterium sp. TaxID=201089 RepID=E1YE19_9BACT|nr:unknown protein [uncultured Desulfobacterium sp.]